MSKISFCENLRVLKFVFSGSNKNLFFRVISFKALEKSEKECNMLEIILVQGFCSLKIKITQFPDEFCLNFFRFNFISIHLVPYPKTKEKQKLPEIKN